MGSFVKYIYIATIKQSYFFFLKITVSTDGGQGAIAISLSFYVGKEIQLCTVPSLTVFQEKEN